MLGWTGNDVMNGGDGQDSLFGQTGDDTYVFNTTSDSAVEVSRDIIFDFENVGPGDKIDVSTIDADETLAGHQTFAFVGTNPLTGAGQINAFDAPNGNTVIQLNTDPDSDPESQIEVNDGSLTAATWTSDDFILTGGNKPEITRYETFHEGDLVFFRLFYTDLNNDAAGFGFRGTNGSGWAEATFPFSDPSYGRVSPEKVEYPFNHLCETGPAYESDVEAWIYDSTGQISDLVSIHLACSAPIEIA